MEDFLAFVHLLGLGVVERVAGMLLKRAPNMVIIGITFEVIIRPRSEACEVVSIF